MNATETPRIAFTVTADPRPGGEFATQVDARDAFGVVRASIRVGGRVDAAGRRDLAERATLEALAHPAYATRAEWAHRYRASTGAAEHDAATCGWCRS